MAAKQLTFDLGQGPDAVAEVQHGQAGGAPGREGGHKGRVRPLQVLSGYEHAVQRGMGKAKAFFLGTALFSNFDLPGHGNLNREDLHGHRHGITRLDRNRPVERKEDVAAIDPLFAQRRVRHRDRWRELGDEPAAQTMQRSGSGNRQRASKVKRLGARGAWVHGEWFHRRAQ